MLDNQISVGGLLQYKISEPVNNIGIVQKADHVRIR